MPHISAITSRLQASDRWHDSERVGRRVTLVWYVCSGGRHGSSAASLALALLELLGSHVGSMHSHTGSMQVACMLRHRPCDEHAVIEQGRQRDSRHALNNRPSWPPRLRRQYWSIMLTSEGRNASDLDAVCADKQCWRAYEGTAAHSSRPGSSAGEEQDAEPDGGDYVLAR
jgi:hypothetical protein